MTFIKTVQNVNFHQLKPLQVKLICLIGSFFLFTVFQICLKCLCISNRNFNFSNFLRSLDNDLYNQSKGLIPLDNLIRGTVEIHAVINRILTLT